MHRRRRRRALVLALLPALLLPAAWLATRPEAEPVLLAPLAPSGSERPAAPWHVAGLPAQSKPFTRFQPVLLDGHRVLRIEASASYGNLVHPLSGNPPAHQLAWRWRLDEPNPAADLQQRRGDDTPAKVCALFDLPLDRVPFVERQTLKLMRLGSSEPVPAATVCYVWDAHLAPGTVLDNAYTRRIRQVVVRGPEAPLHAWLAEQRDPRADLQRLFADELKGLASPPALIGIAVAADADNTAAHSVAHLDALVLE